MFWFCFVLIVILQIFTMDQLASANTHFALDLFQKLSGANPTDNIFFSPLSITSALAMVYLGARGNTATQLSKVSKSVLILCRNIYAEFWLFCSSICRCIFKVSHQVGKAFIWI